MVKTMLFFAPFLIVIINSYLAKNEGISKIFCTVKTGPAGLPIAWLSFLCEDVITNHQQKIDNTLYGYHI
jgi:hypothetical protein